MSPEVTDPGLRMRLHTAPPGLLDRALYRRSAPPPRRLQAALALAATFAVGVALGSALRGGAEPEPLAEAAAVRLVFHQVAAREVAVAGSWNAWTPEPMTPMGHDTFVWDQALPHGQHEYMFLVDGRWVTDPSARVVRDDGFGNRNGVLEI